MSIEHLDRQERLVRSAVESLRVERGWSQTRLANEMNRAGAPWYQTTVSRIEAGERSVSIAEGVLLTSVLGCTFDNLLDPKEDLRNDWEVVMRVYGVTEIEVSQLLGRIDAAGGRLDFTVAPRCIERTETQPHSSKV